MIAKHMLFIEDNNGFVVCAEFHFFLNIKILGSKSTPSIIDGGWCADLPKIRDISLYITQFH